MRAQKWIFGSFVKDLSWILLPGLFFVFLSQLFPFEDADEVAFYAFLLKGFIDGGHVYTTWWRTYALKEERQSSTWYIIVPVGFFLIFTIWSYLGLPFLYSFVVYVTLFHNIRQFFGTVKWYEKLNSRWDRASSFFLYTFCLLPIVILHFRSNIQLPVVYFTQQDLFLFPSQSLYEQTIFLYQVLWFLWVAREIGFYLKNKVAEWNRIFGIFCAAALYGIGFVSGKTVFQIISPIVASHGFSYFGMIGIAMEKTQKKFSGKFLTALFSVVVTAFICGSINFYIESKIDFAANSGAPVTFLQSMLIGLLFVPLFSHYVFDSVIWRANHRDGKKIYT